MDHIHFSDWEHGMLQSFVVIGRELEVMADQLRADYLTVHIPIGDGELVGFTWERGSLWVSGRGFDVELSASPAWRRRW